MHLPARLLVWLLHMALPALVLWLVIARPRFDVRWEDHTAHFWLVTGAAAVSLVFGGRVLNEATRRSDARLFLIAMAFLSSAGFLGLHALATPHVVVHTSTTGFVIATPVGLVLAGAFAVASSLEFSPGRSAAVMRRRLAITGGLAAVLVAWGAISLLELAPLDRPIGPDEAHGPLAGLAVTGVALFAVAAARYYRMLRQRSSVTLLSIITAFVLLAESLVTVALARNWQASWWEWHLLMLIAFAFVAYSSYAQYVREGSRIGLFRAISLEQTVRAMREEYDAALESLVARIETEPSGPGRSRFSDAARGFHLSEGQIDVLERAAGALAAERDQIRRLGGLVAVGQEASVISGDVELLERAIAIVQRAFGRDELHLAVVERGQLRWLGQGPGAAPADRATADQALLSLVPVETTSSPIGATMALPLTVKGHGAGVLVVHRATGEFAERDRAVLGSLTSQLSIALENARLYSQIDSLFRQYMSPDVATALLADAEQAALGGAVVDVSVLFADLRGFTPFSERTSPEEVVAMLNRYFGLAVPAILAEGGTVSQFIGDAIMALFNAPARQSDHPLRAARAALALQRSVESAAREQPGWPRFRVGVNTGPALIGNIGSAEFRTFTGIGDTVNLASRLEGTAEAGQVVIGAATYAAIREHAVVEPRAALTVKGKGAPVESYVLLGLRD